MSNLDGNPHHKLAEHRLEGVHEWQSEEGSTDATNIATAIDAQSQATLALAYEQRTANLIAKLTLNTQAFIASRTRMASTSEAWDAVDNEIITRLGLNGDTK